VIFDHSEPINDGLAYDVLEEFSADQRLKVISRNNVHGLADSMNDGIRNSNGDFIAVLDHDDYWLRNKLSEQVDFLHNNSDIALLGCWANCVDMDDKLVECSQPSKEHLIIRKYALCGCPLTHSALIFRRSIIRDVGLYNTKLNAGAEDYEFLLRVISKGYMASNIEKFLIHYTIRTESITNTKGLDKWRYHYLDYRLRLYAILRLGFRTKMDIVAVGFFPIFLIPWVKFSTRTKWYLQAINAIVK
jgi:glycosyltransferase involved in cell wall biosynthesis